MTSGLADQDKNLVGVDDSGPATVMRRVVIHPEGDVVLQLAKAELNVSSRALSDASKVWRAMFSPRFSEGIALSLGKSDAIPLEDDDTDAMTNLCMVLHHCYWQIDKDITPEGLVELALVTDKYDCVEAISQFSSCCLTEWLRSADEAWPLSTPSYGCLIYPAFTFDDPYAFQQVTKRLLYCQQHVGTAKAHSIKQYDVPKNVRTLLPHGLLGKYIPSAVLFEASD